MIVVAMIAMAVAVKAQNAVGEITLKPMVGMTIANITDGGADSKIGLAAGIEAEFGVAEKFGVTVGAVYSMQGAKASFGGYNDYDYGYGTDGFSYNTSVKLNIDYINVPILANYYLAPGFAIKAGIQPGFKVSSKVKAGGVEIDFDQLGEGDIKSVDFSIPVGLSYEYSGFVIDARYNWGLTELLDGSDSKNSVFMISLGYKFGI